MEMKSFDLGMGVTLRQTYAHLFSSNMMAFAPPGPEGFHPAPWKAAKGGFEYDIEIEIEAPVESPSGSGFDAKATIWWIAALLRLAHVPFLAIPVLSDHPFDGVAHMSDEPILQPFEIEQRIFQPAEASNRILDTDLLNWTRDSWAAGGRLLISHPKFHSALRAFDAASIKGRTSASLLALWGGLEQLFVPSRGELRFRVSSLLASYLKPPGLTRFDLYKTILKLYDQRSLAAHTAQEIETDPLVQTYVLMRNALIKMINENKVPAQDDLEVLLLDSPDT
jgi:hypothetical protein